MELSILCDSQIALIMYGPENALTQYCSSEMEQVLRRYSSTCQEPHECRTNQDVRLQLTLWQGSRGDCLGMEAVYWVQQVSKSAESRAMRFTDSPQTHISQALANFAAQPCTVNFAHDLLTVLCVLQLLKLLPPQEEAEENKEWDSVRRKRKV
jgi:SRF-type transcription factor (DNA-binding and dimerisation domain)